MANVHLYFVVENLGMTPSHYQSLLSQLVTLGVGRNDVANEILQTTTRLDKQAVIYEAVFVDFSISLQEFRRRLAEITGLRQNQITDVISTQDYAAGLPVSTVVTFTYQSAPRLRVVVCGGIGATYQQSNDEVSGYLALNAALWYDYSGGS